MMTDADLEQLLRRTVGPVGADGTHRDLLPDLLQRIDKPPRWIWLDVGVAAAVIVVLTLFPEWLSLLAYHL